MVLLTLASSCRLGGTCLVMAENVKQVHIELEKRLHQSETPNTMTSQLEGIISLCKPIFFSFIRYLLIRYTLLSLLLQPTWPR
ncbi:hypothetical protein E2C01_043602 [Portunus trituberculatus]|uniref:Uncharacterized protein n=1 Tax=Portunus trituberculatus TaxID=210409 RepID=A0A5B7FY06_PORTR|nr:hypothetical protein [Portunus trituberculatus]